MRIGPFTIIRNQAAPLNNPTPSTFTPAIPPDPGPRYEEIGAPGTLIFGGWMSQQDYNDQLQAPACYDVFDRMRLADGQVRAGLNVVKLPLLRAYWQVKPASDSAQDKMIAEFIDTDLQSMTTPYISFLRQALLMLDYGSMPFETVWETRDDGFVHLRKLAPRLPKTIYRWLTDQNGGFAGVQQLAYKASGVEVVYIPKEKMIVFVNEQEGANMRGISMLRAAYKHWYFKDGLYKVDAIAKEKRSVGVDVGTIKPGAQNKDDLKAGLERSLMTLHAHEKQFFVEDEESYTYRLETGNARIADALPSIEHHDLRILRSILAEFLAMGSGSTGSLAMHKDKSAFFLMALEAIADNIAQTMTAHLLKRWVDYNWQVDEYPRIEYSRLDTREAGIVAAAVNQLMSCGALTPTPDTEAELRVILDLPEKEVEETADPTQGQPDPEAETPPAEEQIAAAVKPIQERQLARIRAEIARGKALEDVDVPFRGEMAAAIAPIIGSKRRARAVANLLADRLMAAIEEGAEADESGVGKALQAVA